MVEKSLHEEECDMAIGEVMQKGLDFDLLMEK